jgi:hypothetical protein
LAEQVGIEAGPNAQQPSLAEDKLDNGSHRGIGVDGDFQKGWSRYSRADVSDIVDQAAFTQYTSPAVKTRFTEPMAFTEVTDAELRMLPEANALKPETRFAGLETMGHGRHLLSMPAMLTYLVRCLGRTDTIFAYN